MCQNECIQLEKSSRPHNPGIQATQQIQVAATADSSQLESLPFSSLAADDNGPPQMNYGTEQPLAASTPRATTTPAGKIQPTDTYRQIIPGMSECLYPILTADGLLSTPASDYCSTLHKQITSDLDKYLQEAAEKCESEDNYFDGQHALTNTSFPQQETNYLEDDDNISNNDAPNPILESNEEDTGVHHNSPSDHQTQPQDELATVPEEEEEEQDVEEQPDPADQDPLVFDSEESEEELFNTAVDTTSDDSAITMGKPVTTAFIFNQVQIPTEKVGCLQVTNQLQEFLDQYLPKSTEKAFEHIYQILQVLDKYLIDNPKQHQHCMSPDSEYITLITYATTLGIDLCNFLAIWTVLSILLDTKSNELHDETRAASLQNTRCYV